MSAASAQPVAGPRGESTKARTRRVLSERSAERREAMMPNLLTPIIAAEDVQTLTSQANAIHSAFSPRNGWQDWLTSEIAVMMVRIDRCSRIDRRMREHAAYRAIEFWDLDRKLEIETLALKLPKQPGKTVAKLRQTPAGCDWLLARWRFLAKLVPQAWTDPQRTLAGQLIGNDPIIDPTAPGFAVEQVAELEVLRAHVEEADEVARALVEADLSDDIPNLSRLRRYSRSLHRQMKYYIDQFYVEHPDRWDDPNRKPAFVAQAFINRERERKTTWSFAEPEPKSDETNPLSADIAPPPPEIDETKPSSPEPEPQNAETKPLKPMQQMTADELEANFPPETFACAGYHNEKIKAVDRPKRVDHVRDANQRGKTARRRAALATLGV